MYCSPNTDYHISYILIYIISDSNILETAMWFIINDVYYSLIIRTFLLMVYKKCWA
jgi:hypothetical protein